MIINVQAQGFSAKSKSLNEVLKETEKMEAQLIGFDEKPCTTELCDFEVEEAPKTEFDFNVHPVNRGTLNSSHKPLRELMSPHNGSQLRPIGATKSRVCNPDSGEAGTNPITSAPSINSFH